MKKNDYCMVKPLSGEERVQVSGGCMPPTAEHTCMADRKIRRNVPDMAVSGAGSCDPDLREVQRLCAEGRGPDERGRHPLLRRRTF